MVRCLLLLCVLFAGCQSFVGPTQRTTQQQQNVDNPRLTIEEQQRRGRAQLAYPDLSTGLPRVD